MKIHKEGYLLIFIFSSLLLGLIVLAEILLKGGWVQYLFYLACLVSLGFLIGFFRSPRRELVQQDHLIFSPADGKIVSIETVFDQYFFHEERIQVSIFMSPFNVHVNWYPISGKVVHFCHHPGRYLVAWHPKSSHDNERTTIVLENEKKQGVLIRQIAGAVARRIVCYAAVNKHASQGDELGFIKFGSRVDLLLPKDTQIMVHLNQKVKGKSTVIGCFPG